MWKGVGDFGVKSKPRGRRRMKRMLVDRSRAILQLYVCDSNKFRQPISQPASPPGLSFCTSTQIHTHIHIFTQTHTYPRHSRLPVQSSDFMVTHLPPGWRIHIQHQDRCTIREIKCFVVFVVVAIWTGSPIVSLLFPDQTSLVIYLYCFLSCLSVCQFGVTRTHVKSIMHTQGPNHLTCKVGHPLLENRHFCTAYLSVG